MCWSESGTVEFLEICDFLAMKLAIESAPVGPIATRV